MVPSFNVEGSHANNEIRFDNTGDVPLKIPGLGCRIDAEPNRKDRFRHGIDDFRQDRLVAREIAMLAVMDAITDKPAWHEKVFNEAIVEKWRVEALAMPLISPLAWEWCLRELREMTTFLKKYGFVTTLETCSLCAKADDLIDEGLRQELLTGVMPLLDIKDEAKDWHPNSNNQVLNLVHPSLFPLVYGRTQVLQSGRIGLQDYLSSCGKGEIAPEQTIESGHYSSRFQWLPTEVKFIGTGTDVEITSYINNLHPSHHKSLYSTISKMMGKAIPMWNEMLIKSNRGGFLSRFKVCEAVSDEKPLYLEGLSDYRTDDEWAADLAKVNAYLALPDNPAFDTSNDDEEDETFKDGTWVDDENLDLDNAVDWKFMRVRETAHPEPGADLSYEEWKSYRRPSGSEEGSSPRRDYHGVHLENEFEKQGLQIIVKLASVELSPEKPEYEGGNWHLEGMLNEHIVATAIYYYDVDNVTESLIDFRMEAELDSTDLRYEQDDHQSLATIFGTASLRNEAAIQELGTLKCKQGRLLAFPNTLQHRVRPFKLQDPSRAGHRRFLVLWLVDPHYRIASTANVPPQQHDWIAPETVDRVLAEQDLAEELKDMIREHTDDYPMSLETAKKLRLELMQERTKLMPHVESHFEEYNFCEH